MNKNFLLTIFASFLYLASFTSIAGESPKVILHTSAGDITIKLNQEKAPKTVENFLQYVNDGFYNGTIFHRVIGDFMIQGGGFTEEFKKKNTRAAIQNEANNGLSNKRGSIAMARTNAPHSATAQFFINLIDNNFLNHTSPSPRGWGYAVFGEVTSGMEVVDKIAKARTGAKNGHRNVPLNNIVITSAKVVK